MAGRKASTSRLLRLAGELTRLRKAVGLTHDQVAERSGLDPTSIGRIERAENRPHRLTLSALLQVYGVDPRRQAALLEWLKDSVQDDWYEPYKPYLSKSYQAYIGFEDAATSSRNYESLFIPGLLQTQEYARAVIRGVLPTYGDDDIERLAEVRVQRQAVLYRPAPMRLRAVMDEAAIRREVGGPKIMRAQLRQLLDTVTAPNIDVQIVPFGAGAHPGMPGAFVVLEFTDPFSTAVLYTDGMHGDEFRQAEHDTSAFAAIFDQIAARALSTADSNKLIQQAADAV